jgi:competence protein ComEC
MRFLPVWLAVSLCLGVALGLTLPAPPAALAAALTTAFCLTFHSFIRADGARVVGSALGGLALGAWALASLDDCRARDPPLAAATTLPSPVSLAGVLQADAVPAGEEVRLRLRVSEVAGLGPDATGDASLGLAGQRALSAWREWRAGRRVTVSASVRRPAVYFDAGVSDDRLASARHGLVLVGGVKSAALIEVVERGSPLEEFAASLRVFVRRAIAGHVGRRDPLAGSIATAILIGDRTGLDRDVTDRLQAAGSYHVIAISGGNIAIFASTLLVVAWLVRVPRLVANIGVIVGVWLYAGLVGGGSSVVRAAVMATIYLALHARDLRAPPMCVLSAAAGLMLVASPLAAVDGSFVLTVGATGAIVGLADRALRLRQWPPALRPAIAVVAASLATEAVLLPAAALLFGRVTVAGPIVNLAAVPAMAVVQQAGMIVVVCDAWWPAMADVAGHIVADAAWVLVRSADLMDWAPMLAARVPAPSWCATGTYVLAGLTALGATRTAWLPGPWRRPARAAGTLAALAAAGWIVAHPWTWLVPWGSDGRLQLSGIDVGQGDATLVRLPDASTLLVDAGGPGGESSFDIGARVVAPAVWAHRVGRLDALLLTHGDPDHIGSAPTVIDVFRPSTIWEGILVPSHAPMAALRAEARERGLSWQTLVAGADWERGGVRLHVWSPSTPDWERPKVRNDDSVVLELRYGDVSIVLPGDIGRDVERELALRIPPARLRVLKLAHHGSATSSSAEFLDALRPSLALVSCGRENRFGHPARDVMARLSERHIPVFRTDAGGQIDLETDGRTLTVQRQDYGP